MKLTLEIPDAHTGAILEFVSALVAKSLPVEATTDPAPGHPELPLDDDTPNTDTDFVGNGYRKLQPGETIEDSDEYFNPTEGVWKLTGCAGETVCYGYGDDNTSHLLHRRNVRVQLPEGIPAPPAGFVFVTCGELPVKSDTSTTDIVWFDDDDWTFGDVGWHGATEGPWAVRIGSDIAKANGVNL